MPIIPALGRLIQEDLVLENFVREPWINSKMPPF